MSAVAAERTICCDGCGKPIEGRKRVRKENFHGSTCRSLNRRRVTSVKSLPSEPLLERADLAWRAVRAGADPYLVLSILVWSTTPDEARELLGAAA